MVLEKVITSSFTQGVVTSVIGNVITRLFDQLRSEPTSIKQAKQICNSISRDQEILSAIQKTAARVAKDFDVDKKIAAKIKLFLVSSETESMLRQIFAYRMVEGPKLSLEEIRDEFGRILGLYTGLGAAEVEKVSIALFEVLVVACTQALHVVTNAYVSELGVVSVIHANLLGDELTNGQSNLALFKRAALSIDEINDFDGRYRKQVLKEHKFITPPDLDAANRVPLEKLYVTPSFLIHKNEESDRTQEVSMSQILRTGYRLVILGNPGGGKSTFVKKLCIDLAAKPESRSFAGRVLTPILVTLRDFAIKKRDHNCSIAQYMAMVANADFQIAPPLWTFDYLLLNGRGLVIFDGLDELLDTSDRQRIRSDVEHFADTYPAVPIIVTSREVGYELAPLDEDRFSVFRLAPFGTGQISEYVRKWFALDSSLNGPQQRQKATAFLKESSAVPDLRSNPLLLALMCNIYRVEGYIPKNRPEVYRRCAEMLFEKWDKRRGILYPLAYETHVRQAMNHIAFWIYSDEKLQAGVTHTQLVTEGASFFFTWCVDDMSEATRAATEFIDFCKGRAWVFTDTGTTPDGLENLYQFTHRTFLEYFAADHLVHTLRTPEELAKVLKPRIGRREWDSVAQLAFQLKSKSFPGDGDVLLSDLISSAETSSAKVRDNYLSFAVRSLEFIIPKPAIRRRIAESVIKRCMELGRQTLSRPDDWERVMNRRDLWSCLLAAAKENRSEIADLIQHELPSMLLTEKADGQLIAAELILTLELVPRLRPSVENAPRELSEFWNDVSESIYKKCEDDIRRVACADASIAVVLFWDNRISCNDLTDLFGTSVIFDETPYHFLGFARFTMAMSVIRNLMFPSDDLPLSKYRIAKIKEIGDALLKKDMPWLAVTEKRSLTMGWLTDDKGSAAEAEFSKIEVEFSKADRDSLFAGFVLFATLAELGDDAQDVKRIAQTKVPFMMKVGPLLLARFFQGDAPLVQDKLKVSGFRPEQQKFIASWISAEINCVNFNFVGPLNPA